MAEKKVPMLLCNERTNNILEKVSDIDTKLDKWMTNHATHIQKDMKQMNDRIGKIEKSIAILANKLENQEIIKIENDKAKKEKFNWWNLILPLVITVIIKAMEIRWG